MVIYLNYPTSVNKGKVKGSDLEFFLSILAKIGDVNPERVVNALCV